LASASSQSAALIISLKKPSTMTVYDGLLEQIRTSFTEAECEVELLEAARYHDIDMVLA
jgi:hypothetical protein